MAVFDSNIAAMKFMSKLSEVVDKFSHDGNGIFDQMAADDEYLKTETIMCCTQLPAGQVTVYCRRYFLTEK